MYRVFVVFAIMLATATGCEGLEVQQGSRRPPPTLTCAQHLGECLDSPLGFTQGSYGQSVCVDCFDLCTKDFFRNWPYYTGSFQSCQWWNYTGWVTSPEAGPDAGEDVHGQ